MKKYSIPFFALLFVFYCVCCQSSSQTQTNTVEQTASTFSVWNSMLYAEIEKSFASIFAQKTEQIHYKNYSQCLSQQQLQQLKDMAKKYYENEFSYDLLSLNIAENDCHWYYDYPQYQQGNIIIFKAETAHAGEGIYRYIVFAKDTNSEQWKQINEGY
ncbi:hypothetical protein [Clostridium sp. MD294]|nr:hypothetical protein [Clostridium sp. MD294]USF28674.1 hypothetical protein C820_000048 [Clostridium sp. MD294]